MHLPGTDRLLNTLPLPSLFLQIPLQQDVSVGLVFKFLCLECLSANSSKKKA